MQFDHPSRDQSKLTIDNSKSNRSFADSVIQGMNAHQKQMLTQTHQPAKQSPVPALKFNHAFATLTAKEDDDKLEPKGEPLRPSALEPNRPSAIEDDDISAMSISQCGNIIGALDKSVGNVSAISGIYTKRSPYLQRFKNLENEDSLHMTPISKLEKSDLTTGPVASKQFKTNSEAKEDPQPNPLARSGAGNSEASKLRVELSLMKTKQQAQAKELQDAKSQMSQLQGEQMRLLKVEIELQNKVSELQDQNKLLQQSMADGQQLPSYLSRAQENARKEISSLRSQVCERDQLVAKLQRQVAAHAGDETAEKESLIAEISSLCEQLDKEKLLVASLKKQNEAEVKDLQQQLKQVSASSDDELLVLKSKILEYDNYIQEIIKEYQAKDQEVKEAVQKVNQVNATCEQLTRDNSVLKRDLDGFQQRCADLEQDLRIAKGDNNQRKLQDTQMEQELQRLRDTSAKQISQLKLDKTQMRDQIETLTQKLKALIKDPMVPKLEQQVTELQSEVERYDLLLNQVTTIIGCQRDNMVESLHEVVIKHEESKLVDEEYHALQQSYTAQTARVKALEAEKEQLSKQVKEKDRQLNATPSNFTKNLLVQKDQEILQLKADLDQLKDECQSREEQVWQLQRETKEATDELVNVHAMHKQELNERDAQINQLKHELVALTTALADNRTSAEAQKQDSEKQIEQQNSKILGLQNLIDEMEKDLVNEPCKNPMTDLTIDTLVASLHVLPFNKPSLPELIHKQTECNLEHPRVAMLEEQITGLQLNLKAQKEEHTEQLDTLNEQMAAQQKALLKSKKKIDDLKQEMHLLQTEKEQLEYKQAASSSTAEKARIDQIAKLNKEIAHKNNQIDILKLEASQMELEVERCRLNEQEMIQTVQKIQEEAALRDSIVKLDASTQAQSSQLTHSSVQTIPTDSNQAPQEPHSSETEDLIQQAMSLQMELEKATEAMEATQAEINSLRLQNEDLQFKIDEMTENEANILQEAQKIAQQFKSREIEFQKEKQALIQETAAAEAEANQAKASLKQEQEHRQLDVKEIQTKLDLTIKEHQVKLNELEIKYQKQVENIQKGHESGQESVISKIYDDHKLEIDALMAKNQQLKKNLDDKANKQNAEIIRLKDEVERAHRMGQDKLNKAILEANNEREMQEITFKQRLEAAAQKSKRDLRAAQEKSKVEVLNATENIKNEFAKARAEWEREKKKVAHDYETEISQLKQQMEEEYEEQKFQIQDKCEKQFKKRLQDKETVWQKKFQDIEQEIQDLNEAHLEEIKVQKQKIEARLREQIRSQLMVELQKESEEDQHFGSISNSNAQKESRETQTASMQEVLQAESLGHMQTEINQIREQYNAKLKEAFSSSNVSKMKNDVIHQFEKALAYEFDKILLSLKMKAQNMSQDQLNNKRQEINKQIQHILTINKDLNLRRGLDSIKKQISDVLKLFKDSLEEKSNKKIKDLEKKITLLQTKPKPETRTLQIELDHQHDDLIPQKYISSNSKKMKSPTGREDQILDRLEPHNTNQHGQVVVEVDKVYKDLHVLYHSLRASKFFRLCIHNQQDEVPETLVDVTQSMNEEHQGQIVKHYRDLLNYIFKLLVKLNNGTEQLQKQNELYRLKLLNQDLKEINQNLKQQVDCEFNQLKVNSILDFVTSDATLMNMLSEDALNILSRVQDMSPHIERIIEHQKALLELFTVNEFFAINKNCAEINQNCQVFLNMHGYEVLNIEQLFNLNSEGDQPLAGNTNQSNYEHQQFDEQYDVIDQQNYTQNFLSSVAGDQPMQLHPNQTCFSQDQAVDILAQVLQKLTNPGALNNTHEHFQNNGINQIQNENVYASQQYAGVSFTQHERKNSTHSGVLINLDDPEAQSNENCIKQAESLLNMFRQNQEQNIMQQTAASGFSGLFSRKDSRTGPTSKSQTNFPMQKRGSTSWSRNNHPVHNSTIYASHNPQLSQNNMITTPQNRSHAKSNKNSAIAPNKQLNYSQNVKSLENMSNISASVLSQSRVPQASKQLFIRTNSSKATITGPPVPPLQLKQQALPQNPRKQNSILNTADDYFKLQKQKQMEKRNNSQANFQKIEKVVSPINSSKQIHSKRQESTNSISSQLQPMPEKSKYYSHFQTIEHHPQPPNRPQRPVLPKSKRPPPGSSFQTLNANDESVSQSQHIHVHDGASDVSQSLQSLTFRKKMLLQKMQQEQQSVSNQNVMDQSYVNTATEEEDNAIMLLNLPDGSDFNQKKHPIPGRDERIAQYQTLHNKKHSIMDQIEPEYQATGYKNMRNRNSHSQNRHGSDDEVRGEEEKNKQTIPIYESKEINNNHPRIREDSDDNSSTSTNQQLQRLRAKQSSHGSIKANRRYE